MLNKNIYYLAIKHYEVIPKLRDKNISADTLLNNWIEEYGLDFLGYFNTAQEALEYYITDSILFGEFGRQDNVTISHLEKCLQL